MAFKKNSPDAIAHFESVAALPGAERGLMFGCPVFRLDGERYASLFEEQIVVRLAEPERSELLEAGGRVFEPLKGRKSKDGVVVPSSIVAKPALLSKWIGRSADYVRSLGRDVKKPAKKAAPKRTKRP